jgi:DNA-binding FadR family transcriptional regulator
MKPGQSLPREDEWADELGVSRTVLREATKVLISKRLVESRPKAGTKVRAVVDWNILDPDVLSWRLKAAPREQLVRELFELRRILEPAIAARAAEKATEQDIEALTVAYAAMERAADDSDRFIGPDAEFHKTIVRSVENRMVDALGGVIDAALTLSLKLSLDAPDGQRPSLPLHRKVLDAIRRHDRNGASRAMELLIDNAQQDALRALGAEHVPSSKKRRSA